MARRILVVDDELSIQESISGILSDEGFETVCASNAEEGLRVMEEEQPDLVLLDIWMPGMDGLAALRQMKGLYPRLPVVMISGHGTIETAVQATRMGAYDFIEKPPTYEKIVLSVHNALQFSRLEEENLILRQKALQKPTLTGNSPVMEALRQQIERVSPTDAWVLIRGAHGTGKELVAQTIHRLSKRSQRPMIEVNCAAIPEELIESELFGHEKGSFTGASASKRGKFDQADGGVLFLDEIGDMSLKTQAKILRILQEQKFERVGGSRTISVDVRVLAATNKILEQEIAVGNFREDLFWRLNVVPIYVPPLLERKEDIPLLVAEFLAQLLKKGLGRKSLTPEALAVMMRHNWPGNVRELKNVVERLVIMCPEQSISAEMVAIFLKPAGLSGGNSVSLDLDQPYQELDFKDAKRIFEREFIRYRLDKNSGNISRTAEQIGLERSHLHKKMKSLGLDGELD